MNHRIFRHLRAMVQALAAVAAMLCLFSPAGAQSPPGAPRAAPSGAPVAGVPLEQRRMSLLGPGDQVSIQVYGEPDMDKTGYVGDDGTLNVALVGAVKVSGLSPQEAAQHIEHALVEGQYLVHPQVSLSVTQPVSQRVSVLGEVHQPGRYPVAPNTTIFDLLAQAGGTSEIAGDAIYVERASPDGGKPQRFKVNRDALASQTLQSGDSVSVPAADQFYIYGEVSAPSKYRIEPGMTVIQAIARAGGITPRGSDRRVDIKRLDRDGQYVVRHAKAGDMVEPNDVIHVKESIF